MSVPRTVPLVVIMAGAQLCATSTMAAPAQLTQGVQTACGVSGSSLEEFVAAVQATPGIEVEQLAEGAIMRDNANNRRWTFFHSTSSNFDTAICRYEHSPNGHSSLEVDVACFGDAGTCTGFIQLQKRLTKALSHPMPCDNPMNFDK